MVVVVGFRERGRESLEEGGESWEGVCAARDGDGWRHLRSCASPVVVTTSAGRVVWFSPSRDDNKKVEYFKRKSLSSFYVRCSPPEPLQLSAVRGRPMGSATDVFPFVTLL